VLHQETHNLHQAIRDNDIEMVEVLLDSLPSKEKRAELANNWDDSGLTSLTLIDQLARVNYLSEIDAGQIRNKLLSYGASPVLSDFHGNLPRVDLLAYDQARALRSYIDDIEHCVISPGNLPADSTVALQQFDAPDPMDMQTTIRAFNESQQSISHSSSSSSSSSHQITRSRKFSDLTLSGHSQQTSSSTSNQEDPQVIKDRISLHKLIHKLDQEGVCNLIEKADNETLNAMLNTPNASGQTALAHLASRKPDVGPEQRERINSIREFLVGKGAKETDALNALVIDQDALAAIELQANVLYEPPNPSVNLASAKANDNGEAFVQGLTLSTSHSEEEVKRIVAQATKTGLLRKGAQESSFILGFRIHCFFALQSEANAIALTLTDDQLTIFFEKLQQAEDQVVTESRIFFGRLFATGFRACFDDQSRNLTESLINIESEKAELAGLEAAEGFKNGLTSTANVEGTQPSHVKNQAFELGSMVNDFFHTTNYDKQNAITDTQEMERIAKKARGFFCEVREMGNEAGANTLGSNKRLKR